MQLSELAEILSNVENDRGCLYIDDGYNFDSATIDCVYYREGEVVLQSNEIEDTQEYAPTTAYIQHCLDWFDYDDDVCVMYCDEDNDYDFTTSLAITLTGMVIWFLKSDVDKQPPEECLN